MPKGVRELIAEANASIETISPAAAAALVADPDVVFVDLREEEELRRDGMVPGALHVPRGMLEFRVDPQTPYHMREFSSGKRIVFYCAGGGRSALAALRAQEMGVPRVAHIGEGFKGWLRAGGNVETLGGS